ncbi:MAG TPA: UDP-3-O-(3-hydroxymyristoyl)glucosamine N-acyltransferase [Caulobacteraceae bacterium]|nr:UDP-3-O-(3-hydroxymyristoyl)glucosamine N-acyltransferase [Caulobacteraceae bacterium]
MPDSRFFETLGPVSLAELAAISGAVLARQDDGERRVAGVAPLARGDASTISFFADRRYLDDLRATGAGACFVAAEFADQAPAGCALLITPQPHFAYAAAADRLHRARRLSGEDPAVHPTAVLEEGVALGHGVVIGAGAEIGRGAYIGPHAVIGPGCAIGRNSSIGAHAVIGFALIGDRVRILAGATIGEPGFGVTAADGRTVDVPQLGRVIIQDNVSIGAQTCIDRGAWDDTVIGENTKIDNLVQIAHNVRLGRGCLLAARTGISGSCEIGDGVAFGGGAGLADHVNVGDGARVGADAGVMRDIPAGTMWIGSPARPTRQYMRELAWVSKMAATRGGGSK